jgi:hypothetical protein
MYTFGEVTHDPHTGRQLNAADRLRDLIEEIELRQGSRAGGKDGAWPGRRNRSLLSVTQPAISYALAWPTTAERRNGTRHLPGR